jgi:hypothetical protein
MTDEVRCIHDLLVNQCGTCKPAPREGVPTWEAKWPAPCHTCGVRIETGDNVKWTSDGLYPQHAHH